MHKNQIVHNRLEGEDKVNVHMYTHTDLIHPHRTANPSEMKMMNRSKMTCLFQLAVTIFLNEDNGQADMHNIVDDMNHSNKRLFFTLIKIH
jgi:hypothetical protein